MPSLVGSLYVSLTADYAQYQRNMRSAETVTAKTAGGIRRQMGLTERSVGNLQRSMNSGIRPGALIAAGRSFDSVQSRANLLRGSVFALTAAFGGLGAALTSNVISRYLDTFTGLSNQMRVVTNGAADLTANIGAVAGVAERSRSSLSAVATLYSRIAKATPGEGAVATLRRVETINKALQLGGATAQESASAAIQLSQAIASNRLGGEEMRAVLETPLGLELAKGLGVTIGKFREMGYAGEITAAKIFEALDKIGGSIDQKFAASVATIDQALTVADGKLTIFAGKLDETYGITKLLTGGIIGLANNLDTLLPAVGALALGLGSTFAARRVGPGISNRLGSLRAERAMRLDNLRMAKEEFAVASKERAAATAQLSAAGRLGDRSAKDFANPADLKRYQRDLAAVQKLDKQFLGQLEDRRNLQYQLGQVTRTTTAGAVKASEQLAAAQQKVNEGLSKQWSARAQLQRVDKQLANMPKAGVAPNWLFPADVDKKEKELLARRAKLATDLARVEATLTKDQEALGARQIRVTELTTEAERRAAAERTNILQKQAANARALERTNNRRGLFSASLRAAGSSVQAGGMANIGDAQLGALTQAGAAMERYSQAATKLSAASRAATMFSQSLSTVRAVGGSLIGFLGGPWGVAFTAAIGLLTVLGMRAQASAEQLARAQQIINDELGLLADSDVAKTADQQVAIVDARILAEAQRLADLQAALAQTASEIINGVGQGLARLTTMGGTEFFQLFTVLAQKLQDGRITIGEFVTELQKLGLSAEDVNSVTAALTSTISKGTVAEQTIALIEKRLEALNGQKADILIKVNVDDPSGLINGSIARGNSLNRGLGDIPPDLVKLQTDRFKQTILNRAKEDPAQAIKDRAAALYEEGRALGLTIAEAEELAKKEIALEKATKDSAKGARSAVKDYEKFANKLEELQQTAAASGLGDLDRDVVQFATSLKNGAEMMRRYLDAISSGDLSKAPAELLKVRDALLQIEANQAASGILQQYGTGAQLAATFAEQQNVLNQAVLSGKITAEQASVAWADFLSGFGEYEWVDQLASATTDALSSIITDFKSAEDAALNFGKALLNIALQALVLKPFENMLRGFLGGGIGGGFSGSAAGGGIAGALSNVAGNVFSGLYHSGGTAGSPSSGRIVPASTFDGAPRYHKGLLANETAAILERGEKILTEDMAKRTDGTIAGLSAMASRGGGLGTLQVIVQGARGNAEIEEMVMRGVSQGIKGYDKTSGVRFPRDARNAKTRGAF